MILGCTEASHGNIKKQRQESHMRFKLQYVVVAVAVMCHVFSMQTGQAEKTKQLSTGSQR